MRVLAIGDLVGENGVKKLKETLPKIREQEKIDFVIVNAENVAGGMGITFKNWNDLLKLPIDVVTMGNHTWAKKDIFQFINHPKLIRPANYSKGVPGKGYTICKCKDKNIVVMNLIGRTDMNVLSENPFTVADELVQKLSKECDMIFVEFHAEATAEKIAMGYFLDGKVTCVFGTHTHVATADETIISNGTAYITDIGMTGPKDSVIGLKKEVALKRFVEGAYAKYECSQNEAFLNGLIVTTDDLTHMPVSIDRINM